MTLADDLVVLLKALEGIQGEDLDALVDSLLRERLLGRGKPPRPPGPVTVPESLGVCLWPQLDNVHRVLESVEESKDL